MVDAVAEWLRRVIRNHLGLSRVGSSPTGVVVYFVKVPPFSTQCRHRCVRPLHFYSIIFATLNIRDVIWLLQLFYRNQPVPSGAKVKINENPFIRRFYRVRMTSPTHGILRSCIVAHLIVRWRESTATNSTCLVWTHSSFRVWSFEVNF